MKRFLDPGRAFEHPVTLWITVAAGGAIVLGLLAIVALTALGRISPALRGELWKRTLTWLALSPFLLGPVLLGPGTHILAVAILSLWCLREYDRATGLFRDKLVTSVAVLGILAVTFAALDHWYRLFVALFPLTVVAIAVAPILQDRPKGYIQRVGLGTFGFVLFGSCLGHHGYMGNDPNYRPIVLMVLLCVALNDVFAFCVGKTLGRRKLVPQTSPNKTVAGALGALVLTTALGAWLGHHVFAGTAMDRWERLVPLGMILSLGGQLGDLTLSSIKRDLGIKDMSALLPGHGGMLDRFNSLILTAPAVFHYVGYHVGFGLDQPARIYSGP